MTFEIFLPITWYWEQVAQVNQMAHRNLVDYLVFGSLMKHDCTELFTQSVLVSMSLRHSMAIEIFYEIAYIGRLGCISSYLSCLMHWSCKPQILLYLYLYFYHKVICRLPFYHIFIMKLFVLI